MRLGILTETGVAEFTVKSPKAIAAIENTRHLPGIARHFSSDMAYIRSYVSRTLALRGHCPKWNTFRIYD